MGLDIYLYRYNDYKKTKELTDTFSQRKKEIWNGNDEDEKYNLLSEEQKEKIREEIKTMALSLGLDKWGSPINGMESIELPSSKYPDHLFKIGYFRSSYNEGGIQRILRNLDLPTLDDVFDQTSDDYEFQPNWEKSLERINDLIEKFKSAGAYRVSHVSKNIFGGGPKITTEKEALNVFLEELERNKDTEYNYSNAKGVFSFHEPTKVLAMIPGTFELLGQHECIYVVTQSDNEWYIQALEIVKETIEYVLSQENKEQYYLHWSG